MSLYLVSVSVYQEAAELEASAKVVLSFSRPADALWLYRSTWTFPFTGDIIIYKGHDIFHGYFYLPRTYMPCGSTGLTGYCCC
jgi:hypothetical protein